MPNQNGFDQMKQSIRVHIKGKSTVHPLKPVRKSEEIASHENGLKVKENHHQSLSHSQQTIEKPISKFTEGQDLLRDQEIIQWGSPGSPFFHPPKKKSFKFRSSWMQIVISIVGAILVGTVLGFSVLHLFFSDNPLHSTRSIDDHLPVPSDKSNGNQPNQTGMEPTKRYSLPVLHVVMLQAGNFKEKTGAMKAVQNIRTKGMAAAMTEQSPFRIYAGVAKSRDEALKLSTYYQNEDISVFLKDVQLGGEIETTSSTIASFSPFFEKAHQLCEQLSASTVKHLGKKGAESVSAGFFQQGWLETYTEMVQEAKKMKEGLPTKAQANLDQMVGALDQAIKDGQKLEKNSDPALLWKVQEGLIRYTLFYEAFLQEVQ